MSKKEYQIPTVTLIKEGGGEYEFLSLEGIIELPSWKCFQRKSGRFASLKRSDNYKSIRLSIGGDQVLENPVIIQEHVSAYEYVLKNQEKIKESIINTLLIKYPSLQEQYNYDDEDANEIMPNLEHSTAFSSLIELSSVYILNISKDGLAYVGFSFWCTWDEEHGLGIMTHKNRVVEIGGNDTAFLTWIAERDLNPEEVNKEIEANYRLAQERHAKISNKNTKLWWKFW